MSKPINIKGPDEFKEVVANSNIPVIVDFWTSWCMPCRMMAPVLDDISDTYKGQLKVAKVDTEIPENRELSYVFGIQSIPNLKVFKDGKIIHEFIGYRPKETFNKEIDDLLKALSK